MRQSRQSQTMKCEVMKGTISIWKSWGTAGIAIALLGTPRSEAQTVSLFGGLNLGGDTSVATSYRGEAAVTSGNVLTVPIQICDTGPLPSSGGAREASVLQADVAGTLSLEV